MNRSAVVVLAVFVAVALFAVSAHSYNLATTYAGTSFFDNFQFNSFDDPTHGYVDYVTKQQAWDWGLINVDNNKAMIKTDAWSVSNGRGRAAVRLQSNASYNQGSLFVLDLDHMPEGCGTWPAYWLVGPNWPNSGEIDIIEGVNTQTQDSTTLHTNGGCSMQGQGGDFSGSWSAGPNGPQTDCDVNDPRQYANSGCGIVSNANIYGSALNNNGGGFYVTEWQSDHITMWYFTHSNAPGDLTSNNPNPGNWPEPYARFRLGGNCNPNHFANMNIIINLTFCGDWAGAVFGQMCPGKGDCISYVQNNPGAFANAFWLINSIKVYH